LRDRTPNPDISLIPVLSPTPVLAKRQRMGHTHPNENTIEGEEVMLAWLRALGAVVVFGAGLVQPLLHAGARAEVSEVSIAKQYGAIYLPIMVMEHQGLVEKHLKAQGLPQTKVGWPQFAGPSVIVDAILSGNAHFGAQGAASLMILWDKTRGGLEVKGVSALCDSDIWMNSRRPGVKSLKDIQETDRITITSLKTAASAIFMGMQAEKEWGIGQHAKLDHQLVAMAHPDAVAAMLNPNHEVGFHWATSPFHEVEMKAGATTVMSAYSVMGGQTTLITFTSTTKFRNENPKSYAAVLAAVDEARDWINADKKRAAALYLALTKDKRVTLDEMHALLSAPGFEFGKTPRKIGPQADYMHRVGLIKTKPASWKDVFFPEVHGLAGD
jgi:NitT/TauT family transport system substrate-binding protein